MFCVSCGAEQSAGATFCNSCGSSLEQAEKPNTPPVAEARSLSAPAPVAAQAQPAQVNAANPQPAQYVVPNRQTNPNASDVGIWVLAALPVLTVIVGIGQQWGWVVAFLVWLVSLGIVAGDNGQTRLMNGCLALFFGGTLPIIYLLVRASTFRRGWAQVCVYAGLWLLSWFLPSFLPQPSLF